MEGQEGGKKGMRGFDYRVSATTFEPGNLARYCSATDTAGERREKTREGVWGKVGERGGGSRGAQGYAESGTRHTEKDGGGIQGGIEWIDGLVLTRGDGDEGGKRGRRVCSSEEEGREEDGEGYITEGSKRPGTNDEEVGIGTGHPDG